MLRSLMIFLAIIAITGSVLCQTQEATGQPSRPDIHDTPAATKSDYPFDSVTDFSALMIGGMMGGTDEYHVYRSGHLFRNEMPDGTYMVTELSTSEAWGVARDWCAHFTVPSARAFPFTRPQPGSKVERIPVSQQNLDGHPSHVEDIIITTANGPGSKMRLWMADDLQGFPIKVELPNGSGSTVIQYKNVSLLPQDRSLFQHPTKCESQLLQPEQMRKGTTKPGQKVAPKPTSKPPAKPQ
jgi:hypothetical protein